jgi:DNA-binding winged helix-turn-helix (wHTH) protein
MTEPVQSPASIRFGRFEVSAETGELRKDGQRLKLSGQAIQVLAMLVANPGKLVTREELQQKLWPGASFGDPEHGLNAAVNKLREALGDSATEPKYIETIPGRGYRFIANLESAAAVPSPEGGGEAKTATAVAPTPKLRRQKLLVVSSLVIGALGALALVVGGTNWTSRQALTPFSAKEWFLTGDQATSYEFGTDPREVFNGHPSACLRSKERHIEGFAGLGQGLQAHNYQGKRVRFRGFVKSNGVRQWAGLWMSVNKNDKNVVAFDNMANRPIQGTTDWKEYEVVLDVPQDANLISFGAILIGTGTVWLNGVEFDVVGGDVPTTDQMSMEKPKVGFEK